MLLFSAKRDNDIHDRIAVTWSGRQTQVQARIVSIIMNTHSSEFERRKSYYLPNRREITIDIHSLLINLFVRSMEACFTYFFKQLK